MFQGVCDLLQVFDLGVAEDFMKCFSSCLSLLVPGLQSPLELLWFSLSTSIRSQFQGLNA